jgi:hypothetical protein
MHKGLFVSFEGLPKTIFDSQVITHISEMRNEGVEMILWTFSINSTDYLESMIKLKDLSKRINYEIKLFRAFPPKLPFSSFFNSLILLWLLKKYKLNVDFVHARTDYTATVCGLMKWAIRSTIIWDCRGDSVAEFLDSYQCDSLIRRILCLSKVQVLKLRVILARTFCDKAIFVSNQLKIKLTKADFCKPYEIIPCVASSKIFFFSESLRENIRNTYSFPDNVTVIVYSGSLKGSYHVFDKCVSLISRILARDSSVIFLVATPHIDLAKAFLKKIPSEKYRLMSVAFDKVNDLLNAADFGLFLRENNAVNEVASPVKFAEYSLSGLPIIMTDAVDQCMKNASLIGNRIVTNLNDDLSDLQRISTEERKVIAIKAKHILSREATISSYLRIYG